MAHREQQFFLCFVNANLIPRTFELFYDILFKFLILLFYFQLPKLVHIDFICFVLTGNYNNIMELLFCYIVFLDPCCYQYNSCCYKTTLYAGNFHSLYRQDITKSNLIQRLLELLFYLKQ